MPEERQNITQILKDNGLKEYDEMDMLMLAKGRCEQDSYYLEQITELPKEYNTRLDRKVEDFVAFIKQRTLITAEVCEELNCSRQNLNELVSKDRLHPVKSTGKTTLFMKNEIEQRKW